MDDGAVWDGAIQIDEDSFTVDLREARRQRDLPFNTSRDGALVATQLIFKMRHGARHGLQCRLVPAAAPADAAGHDLPCARAGAARLLFGDPHPACGSAVARACGSRARALSRRRLRIDLRHGHRRAAIPITGRRYTMVEPQMGGWGATSKRDGNSAMYSSSHGETFNCPVEIAEARYGFLFSRYALNDEAGGEGLHRGGPGLSPEYRDPRHRHRARRRLYPPQATGLGPCRRRAGHDQPHPGHPPDGTTETYAFASGVRLAPGDVVRITTARGGGWGKPPLTASNTAS